MKKLYKDQIIDHFKGTNTFSTKDVLAFYRSLEPTIMTATVNWRIYELIHQNAFHRIGRGAYTISHKPGFKIVLDKKDKAIAKSIIAKFPLISYCVWRTSSINELYHHIPKLKFLIVEVERDAVESVYYFLKETHKNTFREPDKTLIEDFISETPDSIIVQPLKTESPVQMDAEVSVPTLEKVLVDLYSDDDLFFFLKGNEFSRIVSNSIDKYSVNLSKMLRYAARRGKKEEIQDILSGEVL